MDSSNDHDLLITIKANLANIIDELRLLRDGTNDRLKNVEQNKLDKADFIDFKLQLKDTLTELGHDNDKAIAAIVTVEKEQTRDIKIIYRYIWGIMGGVILLNFFAKYLLTLIFK